MPNTNWRGLGWHGANVSLKPRDEMDRLVQLLLGDRRVVDSEHAALRSRRRQAQATSVRERGRKVTLPRVSILERED